MSKILLPDMAIIPKKGKRKNEKSESRDANTKRNSKSDSKVARNKATKISNGSRPKKVSGMVNLKKAPEREETEFDINSVLKEGYEPELEKYGVNEGYLFIQRHIFDWIDTHKYDWPKRFDEYPYYGEKDVIRSILYYILRDGEIFVLESRDHLYYRIKIGEM